MPSPKVRETKSTENRFSEFFDGFKYAHLDVHQRRVQYVARYHARNRRKYVAAVLATAHLPLLTAARKPAPRSSKNRPRHSSKNRHHRHSKNRHRHSRRRRSVARRCNRYKSKWTKAVWTMPVLSHWGNPRKTVTKSRAGTVTKDSVVAKQQQLPYVMKRSGLYHPVSSVQRDAGSAAVKGPSPEVIKASSSDALLVFTEDDDVTETDYGDTEGGGDKPGMNQDKTQVFNRPPEPLETDPEGRIVPYVDFEQIIEKIEELGGEEVVFGEMMRFLVKAKPWGSRQKGGKKSISVN